MRHGSQRLTRVAIAAQRRSIRPLHLTTVLRRWQSQTTAPPALPPRQWSTPLAKNIAEALEVTGPVSIASYMRQCLTSPDGGYYTTTRPTSDQFGKHGDFVTSPEISQVFGELVGIWFMTEWMAQGRPRDGVQFMEVGPGRGTLMADVLRTVSQFRSFGAAVEGVWLVEAGEGLRQQQKALLCGEHAEMKENNDGQGRAWWESRSKYGNGIPIRWVEDVALLPRNETEAKMPFIVAHEFFDALPIYAFESVAPDPEAGTTELLDKHGKPMVRQSSASKVPQWRELLVAPTKRQFVLPLTQDDSKATSTKVPAPEFQLVLAKASNPSSLVLPERSRYRALKSQPGSRIEISPESTRYVQDFAKRIGGHAGSSSQPVKQAQSSGAALIIDYGPLDTIPINSLRGIKSHQIVSPFTYAGQADISADVDFGALVDSALEASDTIEVHGPVEQGMWLHQLGIQDRAERLGKAVTDDETKKAIETGWKRLVEGEPRGMGKAYKIMAILPENGGKRRPVGFGGNVAV